MNKKGQVPVKWAVAILTVIVLLLLLYIWYKGALPF